MKALLQRWPDAEQELAVLRQRWPEEFRDGARCAFLRSFDGEREAGGYPRGFTAGRSSGATRGSPASIRASTIGFG